jgi:hypothetical protein
MRGSLRIDSPFMGAGMPKAYSRDLLSGPRAYAVRDATGSFPPAWTCSGDEAMLAADAERLCGKRYQRHADRQGHHWGTIVARSAGMAARRLFGGCYGRHRILSSRNPSFV